MKLKIVLAIMFALVLSGRVLAAETDMMGTEPEETTSNSMMPGDSGEDESATMPEEGQEEQGAPMPDDAGSMQQ